MRRHRWIVGLAAIGLVIGLAGSAQAATSPGVVYSGNTSQTVPMYIRLNLARTKVASTSWRWNAACTPGPAAPVGSPTRVGYYELPWTNLPLSSAGVWKIAVTQKWVRGSRHFTGTYKVVGKRVGDVMQGTIRVSTVERTGAGGLISTCATPLITFALGNTRRFGGMTSQGRTMAASLSVDRRRARIDWSWNATCTKWTGTTSQTFTDWFDDSKFGIPVSTTGVWKSGAFTYPDYISNGIRYRLSYTLTARTLASSVSGAVSATFSHFDAVTGKLLQRCKSGAVSFNLPA